MDRYFIHMGYDGTGYHGWQIQPNGKTVQWVMEQALSTLLKREIAVTGAGRTDTGVHASHFIAHFDHPGEDHDQPDYNGDLPEPDHPRFLFKLNRFLPGDLVVYDIRKVSPEMHARFSAVSRTYHYHISTVKPLFNRRYSHYLYGKLDLESIDACCRIILETGDFTSFSKLHTDVKTNNCKVKLARWNKVENGFLFEISADRFLRNMVRSLVGTLIDVGQGKIDIGQFQKIVDARDRSKASQSAPAKGLFLVDIEYEGYAFRQIS